jgi:IS30 family transposase
MSYQRVTQEERMLIYRWLQEGHSQSEIARRLGRSRSTISREISRNRGLKGYRPKQAHEKAQARAKRPGPRRFTVEVRQHAERLLKEGWTPEIICGRARREGLPHVCKETIYKHIYKDAKAGGNLWTNLPRSHRKRRRRCPRKDGRSRGRIPNQRRIDARPVEVESRESVGHWEGDLINGAFGTGNLVTLVERNTRFALVARTDSKEAAEVTARMCDLLLALPSHARSSVTLDNGKEFAQHELLSREVGMDVFFAYPYHSWERGSNEQLNGLIRRLHPKRSSFLDIDAAELQQIERYLNDRPRRCLDWKTPREAMSEFMVCA